MGKLDTGMQTVIVADDSAEDAALVEYIVNKAVSGTHIKVIAVTGMMVADEVCALIDKLGGNICLVVTDIRAPQPEDGLSIVDYASQNRIPVMVVSGTTDDLNGHAAKCLAVFEKPLDIRSFRDAVRDNLTNGAITDRTKVEY